MPIFERISQITKANINWLIDKIKRPEDELASKIKDISDALTEGKACDATYGATYHRMDAACIDNQRANLRRWGELAFTSSAFRADPVGGEVFKCGSGGDSTFGVTFCGIVPPATYVADILHFIVFHLLLRIYLAYKIEHCHSDRQAVSYLFENATSRAIRNLRRNLHASVDRSWMHDKNVFAAAFEAIAI